MTDNSLISQKAITAYKERLKRMNSLVEASPDKFIDKYTAVSQQVENLHVKAKIGEFEIESDEPKDLGGDNIAPNPMQLLLASIANCLELTALTFFSLSNLKVDSIKVKVSAYYDKSIMLKATDILNTIPGFYDFTLHWYIRTEENSSKVEEVLDKVQRICPAKGTITKKNQFSQEIYISKTSEK
ncbi:MAG: hypothetical protein BAJALOKI2v1_150016 [Promethearchaeota archaeon]|nr:MAG: hypothetical protein BAJALOKI2v1_150016 [Candidatus Lokiarchaeota archaeon]